MSTLVFYVLIMFCMGNIICGHKEDLSMKLLEYQSRELFRKFGLPVRSERVASTSEEAKSSVGDLTPPIVVKAQVPVGGRGKAGGVKLAESREEAVAAAEHILGLEIKGIPVKKVMMAEAVDIAKEYYMGIVVDRRNKMPVVMVSSEGGVDIEQVAREKPEAIHKLYIDPELGLRGFEARGLCFGAFEADKAIKAAGILMKLFNVFQSVDSQLSEINPLVTDKEGQLWAVDAKILIDDSAIYRHKDIEEMRDLSYEEKTELDAKAADLSYVKLDGSIGCCVNGAGLAMATMDIIKRYGGDPANFLDIGGSSSPKKVVKAMKIITEDPNVKAILVNIFGGITRCDDVAQGLIEAFKQIQLGVPIVVRLTGTNEERGRELLETSGLPLIPATSMAEGAQKAIEASAKA
jgi:succinyl-CoA synthetase beta subunit